MSRTKTPTWRRLDNAAKIFPPNSNEQDTKVFRFACRLREEVDPEILQRALDKTIHAFPLYRSIIRKGLFWYYFENSNIRPLVIEESKPPCSTIYNDNIKSLLFEVSYYKRRINLEIHHVLTDGVGAMQFLRTLVLHYLVMAHEEDFKEQVPTIDYDASTAEKETDDFKKHYSKGKAKKKTAIGRAYHIKGDKLEYLQVISGTVSVKAILREAHKYNTTLTIYLMALLIYAIGKVMADREKKRPVVVSVPVNLRPYFESASARNFFSVVQVPYYFKEDKVSLEEIIFYLKDFLEKELKPEKFKEKINHLVALERNYFTRAVPLVLKRPTLRLAHNLSSKEVTTSFSNIGKVTMPSMLEGYIEGFDVCVSTPKVQVCLCSFKDQLSISFTSPFMSTEIQKHFFRELTNKNIEVSINTNIEKEE